MLKEKKLIQKLMVDEKRCYLFGRNSQLNDFCIDHQSCSRVHAALVYHKHLNRAFLVDLGSSKYKSFLCKVQRFNALGIAHGTFIGSTRLEGNKPTPLPVDTAFHFGASTRNYVIRERPQTGPRHIMDEIESSAAFGGSAGTGSGAEGAGDRSGAALLGLPESETELDNLTEFNTAHNRRITMIGIPAELPKKKRKVKLTFDEEEQIINPEDVDPTVGRFRNMVESTVIPRKVRTTRIYIKNHIKLQINLHVLSYSDTTIKDPACSAPARSPPPLRRITAGPRNSRSNAPEGTDLLPRQVELNNVYSGQLNNLFSLQ